MYRCLANKMAPEIAKMPETFRQVGRERGSTRASIGGYHGCGMFLLMLPLAAIVGSASNRFPYRQVAVVSPGRTTQFGHRFALTRREAENCRPLLTFGFGRSTSNVATTFCQSHIPPFERDSVKFKLAILKVLAASPGRHLTLDEVRREAELLMALVGHSEQLKRFSALGDIDIFQSGLVSQDDAGLQITDAGRTLLHSLEGAGETGLPFIDHLVGTEERQKIFDLELRGVDRGPGEGDDFDPERSGLRAEDRSGAPGTPDVTSKAGVVDPHGSIDDTLAEGTAGSNGLQPSPSEENRPITSELPDVAPQDAPEFLHRNFGSRAQEPNRSSHQRSGILGYVTAKMRLLFSPWRGHLAQGDANPKTAEPVGRVGGAAFALLSLIVIAACAGAVVAFVQIKSLKSEIALLHRELPPLKERLARLEGEKAKLDLDQQEGLKNKSAAEKNKAGGEIRADQTALILSREEIQMVRDYIKPAPSAGQPAINLGDTVGGATIPLPSQLMEKIPKLLGARFTTRNGSIIILRRDSQRADIVLPAG